MSSDSFFFIKTKFFEIYFGESKTASLKEQASLEWEFTPVNDRRETQSNAVIAENTKRISKFIFGENKAGKSRGWEFTPVNDRRETPHNAVIAEKKREIGM